MPSISERQALLADIEKALAMSILADDGDNESESDDSDGSGSDTSTHSDGLSDDEETPTDELMELLVMIESSRYLSSRSGRVPTSADFRFNIFPSLPENDFREIARVSKASFYKIVALIEKNPVFFNNSPYKQAPVWQQLAVALDRFGNYGNGVSVSRTHHFWGIGKGTCDLYTARVMLALDAIATEYVAWPDESERRRITRRMASQGFNGCVGFIDGTTIPLAQKPAVDGECYYDRKQRYSINAQVICDDRRKILAFYSGWTGSCADSTVYREMQLAQDELKPSFFSHGQYLLADSAYPADHSCGTIIPSYRSNMKGSNIEAFNTCVAHARVVNEHTIGVLKGRWSCLRELRVQIKQKDDMKRALLWMQSCVVLHNILLSFEDDWDELYESSDEEDTDDEEDDGEGGGSEDEDGDAYVFRRKIKRRVLTVGSAEGGILWYRANADTFIF